MLSAFKNFGVTFLIAALLFGVIAYFAAGFVTGTVKNIMDDEQSELDDIIQNPEETTDPGPVIPTPEQEKIPEGESFNFLFMTTDYRPELYTTYRPTLDTMYRTDWNGISPAETTGCLSGDYRTVHLTSLLAVRIDKEKRQVVYSYVTPQARVYTSTGYHTLSEVYSLYGKQAVADHVHAMTGLRFRYTFLLNGYNMEECLDLLGGVTVHVDRDLFHDGKYPTMAYETTRERIGTDGQPWTEHIPNTFLMNGGDISLNADSFYNLVSVIETNPADLTAKAAYSVEIMQKYLTSVAGMDREARRILLAQLITLEEEWSNIDGLERPDEKTETAPAAPDTPEETGKADKNPADRWTNDLYDPETPIFETDDYTMNDYEAVCDLLEAAAQFEPVVIAYPCRYREKTEDTEAYLEADTKNGLPLFYGYRLLTQEKNESEN